MLCVFEKLKRRDFFPLSFMFFSIIQHKGNVLQSQCPLYVQAGSVEPPCCLLFRLITIIVNYSLSGLGSNLIHNAMIHFNTISHGLRIKSGTKSAPSERPQKHYQLPVPVASPFPGLTCETSIPCCCNSSSSTSSSSSSCSFCFFLSSSNARYFLRLFFALLAFFFRALSALIAARLWSPFSRASTFSAKISRAIFWFWERERVAWHFTTIPVGLWISWTAELVLFCWLVGR